MTQEEFKDPKLGPTKSANKNDNRKKFVKKKDNVSELMTRVIIRQLPPTMTEQQFLEDVSPLPDYTEFYYVNGDLSMGEFAFSRAYFKFKNFEEMLIFRDKFDDYVFMDLKGNEYPAIVEYAPLQKMPRRCGDVKHTKVDTKMNTIESDPDYIVFVEELKNSASPSPPPYSADALLEEIENRDVKESDSQMTPLLEFVFKRREERLKFREEKNRKKDAAKKKKIEEKKHVFKERENKPKEQQPPVKRQQEKPSEIKKPVDKKPKQDATYVIKVNAEENKTSKPAKSGEQATTKKENKPNADERGDNREQKGSRIRVPNKDRPAREIYRPGTKAKPQAMHSQQSQPAPSTSSTQPSTSNSNSQPNNNNKQNPKFKNRVFTRS